MRDMDRQMIKRYIDKMNREPLFPNVFQQQN